MAAVVAASKEKNGCVGEEYIQGKHVSPTDFLLKIEEVEKHKFRIRLEERRMDAKRCDRDPQTIRQKT